MERSGIYRATSVDIPLKLSVFMSTLEQVLLRLKAELARKPALNDPNADIKRIELGEASEYAHAIR